MPLRQRLTRKQGIVVGAVSLLVALGLALLPGGWELKLVLMSLAVILAVTTWYRVRYIKGARRAAAESLPLECSVAWRECHREVRDDRFPTGGFGGTRGTLRIDRENLTWDGTILPVSDIQAALVLTPRDWAQRSVDRTVLRIRAVDGVWDFYLAQPGILDRELPFPLERRAVSAQVRPLLLLTYAGVLVALLGFVVLAGPVDFWRSLVPTAVGGPRHHAGPLIEFSYPGSGWSLSAPAAGDAPGAVDLRLEGPDERLVELRIVDSAATPEEAAEGEVGAAVDGGCLRGAWIPAYGRFRGAGAVLVCGEGAAMRRQRISFAGLSDGRLLRVEERRPMPSQASRADDGFRLIEKSLRATGSGGLELPGPAA